MLLLKGPVRKSIVCQTILEGQEPVFGVQYCSFIDLVPTLGCIFINSNYNFQKDKRSLN